MEQNYPTAWFTRQAHISGYTICGVRPGLHIDALRKSMGKDEAIEEYSKPDIWSLHSTTCDSVVYLVISQSGTIVEVRGIQRSSVELDGKILIRLGDPPLPSLLAPLGQPVRVEGNAVYHYDDLQNHLEVTACEFVTAFRLLAKSAQ